MKSCVWCVTKNGGMASSFFDFGIRIDGYFRGNEHFFMLDLIDSKQNPNGRMDMRTGGELVRQLSPVRSPVVCMSVCLPVGPGLERPGLERPD